MKKIRVSLKDRSYDILIGRDILRRCAFIFKRLKMGKDAVIITNRPIMRLYGAAIESVLKRSGFGVRFEIIQDSEKAKSYNVAMGLIGRISSYDKEKELFIIALGGGVIGDVSGLVAAIYKRGIPYAQIPTTLLAQVDSAIGGKVAIDLPIAKNLVGAFYQPRVVLSDTSLIRSLDPRQVRNGLAEIIKYGVIKERPLFEYLERNYKKIMRLDKKALEFVIARSSAIKARLVEKDEFDNKGFRVALNYGHTIGHAIEAASSYSKIYSHGEAIALGMVAASRISLKLGLIKKRDSKRIEALIRKTGLPVRLDKRVSPSKIYESHLHDKKFIHGKNRFVLPTKIGGIRVVEEIPGSIIKKAIEELSNPIQS